VLSTFSKCSLTDIVVVRRGWAKRQREPFTRFQGTLRKKDEDLRRRGNQFTSSSDEIQGGVIKMHPDFDYSVRRYTGRSLLLDRKEVTSVEHMDTDEYVTRREFSGESDFCKILTSREVTGFPYKVSSSSANT
jgi:hypothetical protein